MLTRTMPGEKNPCPPSITSMLSFFYVIRDVLQLKYRRDTGQQSFEGIRHAGGIRRRRVYDKLPGADRARGQERIREDNPPQDDNRRSKT